jgi:hypothetical protein
MRVRAVTAQRQSEPYVGLMPQRVAAQLSLCRINYGVKIRRRTILAFQIAIGSAGMQPVTKHVTVGQRFTPVNEQPRSANHRATGYCGSDAAAVAMVKQVLPVTGIVSVRRRSSEYGRRGECGP